MLRQAAQPYIDPQRNAETPILGRTAKKAKMFDFK